MADRCAQSGLDIAALEGWSRDEDWPSQCKCGAWIMVRVGVLEDHARGENKAPLPV